jgi:hypothetical protein
MTMLKKTSVAAVAAALPLVAAADEWTDAGDGCAFMIIDKTLAWSKDLHHVNGYRIWIRITKEIPVTSLFEVNCLTAPSSYRILSSTIFDHAGKVVASNTYDNTAWEYSTPGVGLDETLTMLCNAKPAAGT